MPLEPGSSIGPYYVNREIGRGGMGVVYRARDPRLQRDVAIKALPDHLADDPVRLERFRSEAKTLAQLNHPSVAGIHGLEEKDGQQFLILEYVEGETLSERLERGTPPVDEALELAVKIAAGIEAAHDAGVIHRDLKPDNIRITPSGDVKILDFGLAKIGEATTSSSDLSKTAATVRQSPTLPGMIMGTAAYMSPEQARGRIVDKRTDIWSFGVVLFELLTGASPFAGESDGDSIGAVLHKEVDFDRLPAGTPAAVRRVLTRCLVRDRSRRFRDIGDVRLELEGSDDGVTAAAASTTASRLPLVLVAVVALVATAGWALTSLRPTPATTSPSRPTHLSIALPAGMEIVSSVDISTDGRRIVFCARKDGEQLIYVRSLDGFDLQVVDSSRDGENPTFSPDGEAIVFYARNGVWRAPVDGGPAVRLDRAKWMTADWDEEGSILLSEGINSSLFRIPAGGGARTPVTQLSQDDAYGHAWPQRIPGTNKVLFDTWKSGDGSKGSAILDLDTGGIRQLSGARGWLPSARWSASGHLILETGTGLRALRFDPESSNDVALGDARQILDNVFRLGVGQPSAFALSDEGTLVYAPATPRGRRLIWVDQDGSVQPIIEGGLGNVALSRDERTVVTGGSVDIIEVDVARGTRRNLTPGGGHDTNAVWSADESRVLFNSQRDTRWSIWSVDRSDGAEPELVLQRDENVAVLDVAPDGSVLVRERVVGRGNDLLILAPDGEVRPLAASGANESTGAFSNDGEWVAYDSDESGRTEVYLRRADGTGTPLQVTVGGGEAPKFGRSGTTLYYRQHRRVFRVGYRDGRPVGEAVAVFEAPNLETGTSYDINADETRMIAVQVDDASIPRELRVITSFYDVIRDTMGESRSP